MDNTKSFADQTKKKTNFQLFLCIICVISNLSYYPLFVRGGTGRTIAVFVWVLLGIVVLLRAKIKLSASGAFQVYAFFFAFFIVNSAVVSFMTGKNAFDNHFFQTVLIASIIFVCASTLQSDITPDGIRAICRAYFDCMALIAPPLFIFYLRGTDLTSRYYSYKYGKNEISVLLLAALIICFTVYKPKTVAQQLFRIAAAGVFLLDIIFLRCRSVLVCVALVVTFLLLNSHRMHLSARIILVIGIAAITIFFLTHQEIFDEFINNIIYAGRKAGDVDDLSSGRESEIRKGLGIFAENPMFGVGKRGSIDCFYVSVLANYGILGWPLFGMSVVPLIWSFLQRKKSDLNLCCFLLASSFFVISLIEELAPFGPGTRCYILWLLSGLMIGRNVPAEEKALQEQKEQAQESKAAAVPATT